MEEKVQTPSASPATSVASTPLESKPVKKPRSAAQLAALAKGREARGKAKASKASKASSKAAVVHDDDSADELLERVKHRNPEARITKRKRKDYDDRDS